MNIEAGERVEGDLDRSIANADKKRRKLEGERPKELSYMPNVRAAEKRRREQNAWDWLRHHERQLANHMHVSSLITRHHEQEIEKYERILGLDHDGPEAA